MPVITSSTDLRIRPAPGNAFWGGTWRKGDRVSEVRDPQDGALIGLAADIGPAEIDEAVRAVMASQREPWPLWRRRVRKWKREDMHNDFSQPDLAPPRPYRPRPVRFLRLTEVGDWRVKVYGITAHGDEVSPELVTHALSAAADILPSPAVAADRYGLGFVTVHEAADFCFVLIHWWAAENEVHQRILSAPLDHHDHLARHDSPAIGCVWELSVTNFERRAWIECVLANPGAPDIDNYLSQEYNDDV